MHRLAADFAEKIPERDVDRRGRPILCARAGLRHREVEHLAMQRLDVQRVAAKQPPSECVMDVRLDCPGTVEGLAEADHA
jgi:hypothetical protein